VIQALTKLSFVALVIRPITLLAAASIYDLCILTEDIVTNFIVWFGLCIFRFSVWLNTRELDAIIIQLCREKRVWEWDEIKFVNSRLMAATKFNSNLRRW